MTPKHVWKSPPKKILIVPRDQERSCSIARSIVDFIKREYQVEVLTDPVYTAFIPGAIAVHAPAPSKGSVGFTSQEMKDGWQNDIDLCIAIGGDGTLLHATSMFPLRCPPICGFSAGSLGFLMPFDPDKYEQVLTDIFAGKSELLHRRRIAVHVTKIGEPTSDAYPVSSLLNEVVVRRWSRLKGVCELHCEVDGQHLANFQGDGVIVSSATGSTAYSMAAGGPLVHPAVGALVITPLASMTLASRAIVLPGDATIRLHCVHGEAAIETKYGRKMDRSEQIVVRNSPHSVPMFTREGRLIDWVGDLRDRLHYNLQLRRRASDPLRSAGGDNTQDDNLRQEDF
jgi:NAD kinase